MEPERDPDEPPPCINYVFKFDPVKKYGAAKAARMAKFVKKTREEWEQEKSKKDKGKTETSKIEEESPL